MLTIEYPRVTVYILKVGFVIGPTYPCKKSLEHLILILMFLYPVNVDALLYYQKILDKKYSTFDESHQIFNKTNRFSLYLYNISIMRRTIYSLTHSLGKSQVIHQLFSSIEIFFFSESSSSARFDNYNLHNGLSFCYTKILK